VADKILTIYTNAPAATYNASFYYRGVLPLWNMQKLMLPAQVTIDSFGADIDPMTRQTNSLQCDINLSYQVVGDAFGEIMESSRTWPYQYLDDGTKVAPPSFVFDTDDDLFNVSPTNSAFENLGYKDFHGNELEDGQKIWVRHPASNDLNLLWSDGVNVDYSKNKAKLMGFKRNLNLAELITTSGENTKAYILRELGPEAEKKIHIYPNCIDFHDYPKVELAPHPKEIRILWQGSPTHWEDLYEIKDSLRRIMEKHSNVKLIIWGADYPWLYKELPKERVELIGWMDYRVYKIRLSTIGHDIAIAPLRKTVFNQSRSAIKWYESAAVWQPAATLASNTSAFKMEMEDGKTGLLFNNAEEFETKLSGLIEDTKLRQTLAANAKDWIKTNRDPAVHAMALYRKYQEVRAARLEWPEPENNELRKTNKRNVRKRKAKSRRVYGKRVK